MQNIKEYSEEESQDYDDVDTGIEIENDYRGDIQEPFNPTEIRIAQRPLSLDNLVNRLKHGELDLSPDFQRKMGIWDDGAQSRLIESLLIRIPIPAFYFDATDDSKWLVIDGVQRLTALARFVIDEQTLKERYPVLEPLKLCDLEFLIDSNGKTFDELERTYQRRINETQVTVYTIEQGTPTDVKYNIFKRINTGGLPLSDQEIRNALNAGKATQLLADLARSETFLKIADNSIQEDKRGLDQECILRFIAFTLSSDTDYKEYEKLGFDNFLRNTMDSMNKMPLDKLNKLEKTFKKAMAAAHEIFDEDVFRSASRRRYRGEINMVLFEVWSVSLGRLSEADISKLIEEKEHLKDEFLGLMRDPDFSNSISSASARRPKSIKIRFEKVEELAKEILHARELWENIEEKYPLGAIVNGKVAVIKGYWAFLQLEQGVQGWIPPSELSWTKWQPTPEEFLRISDDINVRVLEINPAKRHIRLSYKQTKPDPWEGAPEKYRVGSVVQGRIINIVQSGAIVELEDGPRGFIPISELELGYTKQVKDVVSVDDELDLRVIEFDENNHRIRLSLKAVRSNFWEVGSVVRGRIINIIEADVLVRLAYGINGFIRVSELSWTKKHPTPSKFFEVGDEVNVMVLEIDPAKQHIELSYKQTKPDPWEGAPEKYRVGSVVQGRIVNITNFGAFVELEDGIRGLIRVSELSWTKRSTPSELFEIGDEVDVMVLEIDPAKQHIELSYKQTKPDPWEFITEKYSVGSVVQGRIVNITNFGAFVELEKDIEGLIHISELSWMKPKPIPNELFEVGDEVDVMVIEIDPAKQHIELSYKQTKPDPWEFITEKYSVGSVVQGRIVNITNFGAFVELEKDIEGLIHISELTSRPIQTPDEVVSVAEEVNLKVIERDAKARRISLSLKAVRQEQSPAIGTIGTVCNDSPPTEGENPEDGT